MGEMNEDLALKIIFVIFESYFLHAIKAYDIGPSALLSLGSNACCGFLFPLKIHRLGRV
jgi:hypothetical protein